MIMTRAINIRIYLKTNEQLCKTSLNYIFQHPSCVKCTIRKVCNTFSDVNIVILTKSFCHDYIMSQQKYYQFKDPKYVLILLRHKYDLFAQQLL